MAKTNEFNYFNGTLMIRVSEVVGDCLEKLALDTIMAKTCSSKVAFSF